ncbi:MAG TPA: D-alanyl-D-alanine carboxypeptidase family protein [Pseudogracilibacillus sp.]|nr:D-alanyl-D-alanine carboxypeptidase family protein [Pseudogracilibacillus sp.]
MKRTLFMIGLCSLFLLVSCQQKEDVVQDVNEVANEEEATEETSQHEDEFSLPAVFLQKQDEDADVTALQGALERIGYPVTTSGVFDDMTTWAITDIQLQVDVTPVSGFYDEATRGVLQQIYDGEVEIKVGTMLEKPENNDRRADVIENPYEVLALVNKSYALPGDYEPNDLVVPDVRFPFTEDDPKKQLREQAARALENMFAQAEEDGIILYAQSGYRSYDRQDAIFASNVAQHGEEHANTFSARPGESEHQTGLVMDITSESVQFELVTDFGETEEGKWVAEHAAQFGFIIRYPEGKEEITKYQYEPWHLRYVGEKAATEITEQQITLEEYLGDK